MFECAISNISKIRAFFLDLFADQLIITSSGHRISPHFAIFSSFLHREFGLHLSSNTCSYFSLTKLTLWDSASPLCDNSHGSRRIHFFPSDYVHALRYFLKLFSLLAVFLLLGCHRFLQLFWKKVMFLELLSPLRRDHYFMILVHF